MMSVEEQIMPRLKIGQTDRHYFRLI